jgi:hypothetical protein
MSFCVDVPETKSDTERLSQNPSLRFCRRGFAIMFAVIIGTIMLILAVALYSFVGQQHTGIQNIVNGEIAHFLAEAGINGSIGTVREAIARSLESSASSARLREILLKPGDFDDVCIDNILGDAWNKDLKNFAAEVDKEAQIRVEVWLRDFSAAETDPAFWADPVARNGDLVIESTGSYKGAKRTIAIRRKIQVGSIVPGFAGKFTCYVVDAAKNGEGAFNLIRNDYRGMITDGPRPITFYNHALADSAIEPGNAADIAREETDNEIWKKRGWIWLGGRRIRLNLCSGAGDLGEIFHFYDVSNANVFAPVKFVTPLNSLPSSFASPMVLPWDKSADSIRQVGYTFGHGFVLDGFHDRSSRKESDAMFEGGILSDGEKNHYSSKSSIMHLFGDARKGHQSRTKVFGQVYLAFPRFCEFEV